MKPSIYYIVESLFWRKKIGNKLDFLLNGGDLKDAIIHSQKEFIEDSPIIAREKAFSHFSSIVDVLYEGLEKKQTTDEQARIDLQEYLDSNNAVELQRSDSVKKFKVSDDIFNGIEVYMVVDTPLINSKDKQGQKVLIHGIRYIDYPERLDDDLIATLDGLIKEYKYYEQNNYFFQKHLSLIHFEQIGGGAEFILNTPFNWERLMDNWTGRKLIKKQ